MQDSTILAAQRTELVDISNGRELRQWINNTSRSIRREQLRDLDLEQFITLWRTVGTTAMAQLLESLRSRDLSNAVRALPPSDTVELLAALHYHLTAAAPRHLE